MSRGNDCCDTNELSGRVAIVTGGSRGIGRAVCLALAREGANLVIADLDEAGARETAEMAAGVETMAASLDVSDEAAVLEFYKRTVDRFSTVDILVNSAGICRTTPLLDIDSAEWNLILSVNLLGTFLMSREGFRLMKEKRGGKIISLASAAAKIGGVAVGAHYAASKAGVITLTKSLALNAAPYKVNVNAVCPGPIVTQLTDAWGEETNTRFADLIPWKEYGRPEDVAEAVVFLASDRARYITGEILDVNGGLVMD